MRASVDGQLHDLGTGCQWRAVPSDLPPERTLFSDLTFGTGARAAAFIMTSL
jgi:hypothetical protein